MRAAFVLALSLVVCSCHRPPRAAGGSFMLAGDYSADLPADAPAAHAPPAARVQVLPLPAVDPERGFPEFPGYGKPPAHVWKVAELPPNAAFAYPTPYSIIIKLLNGWPF